MPDTCSSVLCTAFGTGPALGRCWGQQEAKEEAALPSRTRQALAGHCLAMGFMSGVCVQRGKARAAFRHFQVEDTRPSPALW